MVTQGDRLNLCHHQTPLGLVLLTSDGVHLTGLYLNANATDATPGEELPLFRAVCEQLDEYFAGTRKQFDLPLLPEGTPFQLRVWKALESIPFGQTRSYASIASQIGQPTASRAVGLANGRNPISIIIPCHRVIGANGRLTGYSGGLEHKQYLLELERETLARAVPQRPAELVLSND